MTNSLFSAAVEGLPAASKAYVGNLWYRNCAYRKMRTLEEVGTLWLAMHDLRSYWDPGGGASLPTLVRRYLSGKIMQRMRKEASKEEPVGLLFDAEAEENTVEDCMLREALAERGLSLPSLWS